MNTPITKEGRRSFEKDANDLPDGDYFTVSFVKTANPDGFGLGLRTNEEGHVEVFEIKEGTPASSSLVSRGDVIIGIQNEFALRKHKRELRAIIRAIPNGHQVYFHMCRQSRRRTCSLESEKKFDFFGQLYEAIENDDVDLVKDLISNHDEHQVKLFINCPFPPLHKALAEGHNNLANYCITNRLVDLDGYSKQYNGSPLTVAARYNRIDQVKLLVEQGVNTNESLSSPSSPLRTAIECGNEYIAKLLAAKHKELTDPHSPALSLLLYLAVCAGNLELVRHWWKSEINANAPIDDGDNEPLTKSPAADGKRKTLDKFLLIPAFQNTAKAPQGEGKKYRSIINFLLSKGATITLPIAEACGKPTLDFLRYKQKEFPNQINWSSKSLSHLSFDRWLKPYCSQIVVLDLSANPLEEIPAAVPWNISTIEKFVVSNCKSLHILSPPQLGQSPPTCDRLYIITICNNPRLQSIPLQYFQIKSLVEMNLNNNGFYSLPGENELEPWKCEQLEILNLSGNKMGSLPSNITQARNLRKLFVSGGNQIEDFPTPWPCPLLELDLSRNRLKSLPAGFKRHWNNSLQTVNISKNILEDFPTELCELERVTFLDLSNNKIKELPPPEVWRCERLVQLNLAKNLLGISLSSQRTNSPAALGILSRMRRNSGGDSLPTTPTQTPPTTPTKLTFQQRKFSLANKSTNTLSDMAVSPFGIFFPTIFAEKLTNLNLSGNQLNSVPFGVSSLSALCDLNISNNPGITNLPSTLAQMKNLQNLEMTGLDLKMLPDKFNPSRSRTSVRTYDIIRYLRSLLRDETVYRSAKMIVMGVDGSGKTALIRRLTGNFNFTMKSETTIGTIDWDIEPVDTNNRDERQRRKISLKVWELSDAKFEPMLRIFMTDKTLYIIVVRFDQGSSNIRPILLAIKERAPSSKIIVVATKLDNLRKISGDFEGELSILKKGIRECENSIPNCPQILSIQEMTNFDSADLNKLKKDIFDFYDALVGHVIIPRSYVTIFEYLKLYQNQLNALNLSQIWSYMSRAQGIDFEQSDREEFMGFIKVAVNSGMLLHFQEAVRDFGNEWFYFDPAWLSRGILLVLSAKTSARKLPISEAVQLLSDRLTVDRSCAQGIIEVMQRFELLMKMDETQLLVPHNLPKEGPEIDIRLTGRVVCRIYRMTSTPPGFWTRLVARLLNQFNIIPTVDLRFSKNVPNFFTPHRFIRCRKKWTMYWANGVYLKSDKGMLKVESLQTSRIATCIPESVEGVVISWHWVDDPDFSTEPYFGMAVDEVELLINKWFFEFECGFDRVQRLVVCSKCAESIFDEHKLLSSTCNQICCFPLEQITAILTRSNVVKCQFHEELVALSDMIPDLLLSDIDGLPRNKEEIEYAEKLGGGGQAIVLRAHTHDEREIAAKVFVASEDFLRQKSMSFSMSVKAMVEAAARARQHRHQLLTPLAQIIEDSTEPSSDLSSVTLNSICTLDSSRKNTDLELRTVRGLRNMRREACILSALSHPLIIGLCGATFEPNQPFCLMLEYAAKGNLLNYIYQNKLEALKSEFKNSPHSSSAHDEQGIVFYGTYINRYLLYKIVWQIAIALEYLHEANVVYRDLKAENVLIWSDDPNVKVNIKLSDYGISCRSDPQGQIGGEGTRGYQAPELLNNMVYDEKVDVYSFGMMLYELLTAHQPFFDISFAADIDRMVKMGRRPSIKDALVKPDFVAVSDLMERCWIGSPSNRPSAADLRAQLETFEFYSLRHRVEIEITNAFLAEQHSRQIFIVPCNQESNLVCLISTNTNLTYSASLLNTLTGEMIEKDKDVPFSSKHEGKNAMPAAVCHSANAIVILYGPDGLPDTVQLFQMNSNSLLPLPIFLHELPIPSEHAEESTINALCTAQISDGVHCVIMGFQSGKIIAYKVSITGSDADFMSSTTLRPPTLSPISAIAAFKSTHFNHQETNSRGFASLLLAAVKKEVLVLDMEYGQELHTFKPFEKADKLNRLELYMDLIKIADDDTAWIGSRNSFILAKLRFIERDSFVVHLCDDRKDVDDLSLADGLQALTVVNDTVLAATLSKIFVLNNSDGSPLTTLDFAQFSSGTDMKIRNVHIWGNFVLVTLTEQHRDGARTPTYSNSQSTSPIIGMLEVYCNPSNFELQSPVTSEQIGALGSTGDTLSVQTGVYLISPPEGSFAIETTQILILENPDQQRISRLQNDWIKWNA